MTARRWLPTLVTAVAGLCLFVLLFPTVTGVRWGSTISVLGSVSVPDTVLLAVVWFAGLCSYTIVMRASLPGLSLPQALTLNLGGSAVSNLLPFGGAAGVGLHFAMVRSWGYRRSSFAAFTAVTTLVNIAAKLLLPVAAVIVVAASGQPHTRPLVLGAEVGGGLLAAVAAVIGLSSTDNPLGRRLARLDRGARSRLLARRRIAQRLAGAWGRISELLVETRATARRGWQQICCGMAGYLLLQALLLWLIFHILHSEMPVAVVFAGFALERALTLAVATPGGVGIAQTGAAAVMIALGGQPAIVAAGILLYSVFTFFIEIPVGAAVTLGWWLRVRSAGRALQEIAAAAGQSAHPAGALPGSAGGRPG